MGPRPLGRGRRWANSVSIRPSVDRFNGATASRPWKTPVRVGRLSFLLQWGHGLSAVEVGAWPDIVGDSASMGPRPLGRGKLAVTGSSAIGFNGATASRPWKIAGARPMRMSGIGFNGATASRPWKPGDGYVECPIQQLMLQWGHGLSAVERCPSRQHCASRSCFNGATASRPWKTSGPGAQAGRLICFNGATASRPWKRR